MNREAVVTNTQAVTTNTPFFLRLSVHIKPLDRVIKAGCGVKDGVIPSTKAHIMLASTMESFATQAAIASLNTYQKHLSPHKGFSCPHRLLYKGESCSDYLKRILTEQNLMTAIKMAPQRFQSCKFAAKTLQAQKADGGCIIIPCCFPI